jgi:hypothetical protein
MKAQEMYRCPTCEEAHDTTYEAQRCCAPESVWMCGVCADEHDEKADAEACCANTADPAVKTEVQCHFCYGGPLTLEDVRDSQIVGAAPRCRPCILSVAPEMQTADAIATGRAA